MVDKIDLSQYSMEELTALSSAIEKEYSQRRKDRFGELVDALIIAHEDLRKEFPYASYMVSYYDDDAGEIEIDILDEPLHKYGFCM